MTREERKEAIKLLTQYIDYDAETPDYYEMEKACKVAIKELEQEPFINIPEDATNGDVIKALFPNGKVIKCDEATGYEQMIDDKYSYCSWFDASWWNAPYKAESEEE